MKICPVCRAAFDAPAPLRCPEDGSTLYPLLERFSEEAGQLEGHVLGNYVLEELLGRGGMGVVLRARHAFLDRAVAVKLLSAERAEEEARARFFREARAASRVRHPNVVRIDDFGVTPERIHYLVMELLVGRDLRTYARAHGTLDAAAAAHVGREIALALEAIHAHGPALYCLVRDGNKWRVQKVEIGSSSDRFVVIESGLSEGEKVSMNPPLFLDEAGLPNLNGKAEKEGEGSSGAKRGRPPQSNRPGRTEPTNDGPKSGGGKRPGQTPPGGRP